MTSCSDLADCEWLTDREAGAVLDELADDKTPLHTAISRLRGRFTTAQTHLLIKQTELRRRATAKFTQSHQMFFTRIGLEQATDEWVARYKATRFHVGESRRDSQSRLEMTPPHASPCIQIADLCCGIGGDLRALAERAPAFGIERDPVAAHFAAINAGATVHTIDVTSFDLKSAAFHIDPDRRPTGHRTTSLVFCEPGIATINKLLTQVPNAAVKLAPACDVPNDWTARCELEWISRDRECRQLVAWHGNLALAPGQHRATVLSSAPGLAPRTITGHPKKPIPIAGKPNRYIFDIDPAVLAAKLKGALAAQHDLQALSAGPTYLTGEHPIKDPALTCFEVEDILPFRTDKLAKHLRAHNIGQLEIKKCGVGVAPDKLRRELKLRGANAATLLITPIAGRPTAILACRTIA